ncbi:hypothetical protein C8K30_10739 [Promicromonospora sp. AC04]|uniref:DUF1684 domain-containing protein n=1 Tax=Promicromonospora sp. AC04 TaxID=2135723 RepID=UPI000D3DA1D4|nr:DUF1684 domain-containing protein [Promicromonospora sp. AC04]PUB25295.1 hypothetical protein C8K30_10739 [Promicromonospora sp. AC04]
MTEALHTGTAGTTAADDDAVSGHAAWRAARERELLEPHGWLSPVALLWPTATPRRLPGVPGEWWVADGVLYTRPAPGDTAALVGERVVPDGPTAIGVGEGRSRIIGTFLPEERAGSAAGADGAHEVAVEVVVRTGRYGVRLRDPQAATRTEFTGVPAFDYDPSWVLDAPVRWYDEPESVTVGAAQPGLVHHVEVFGEVDLVRGGRFATLALTGTLTSPTIVFSDEADGVAPWRALLVTTPDGTGDPVDEAAPATSDTLRLDLNRAVNLPHAFTDFGTSAAPLAGNHLPFAVTAGEKAPR